MTDEKEVMGEGEARIYEVGYHIIPSVAEENVPAQTAEIKALIEKVKGTIIAEESATSRPLAYSIAKMVGGRKLMCEKAYFGSIKFEADASGLPSIKEVLETNENVLRFMIVKTVRENTMAPTAKVIAEMAAEEVKEVEALAPVAEVKEVKEKKAVSAEELDKTIDDLLV